MNKERRPENSRYIGTRDIAKLAGISTATVSRIINNPEVISERVRKRVQKVTEEYSYIPNQPVEKTFSRMGSTVTVFIYDMGSPFFTSLAKKLSQICLEHNYMLLICDIGNSPELKEKYLHFCLANRCASIILTEGVNSDIFEACGTHIPTAFLNRKTHGRFSSVRSSNRQMMQPIMDYLYNLGHRKTTFVSCRTPMNSVTSRQDGYIEAMAGKGFPIIQEYIYDKNPQLTLQTGSQALNYFLSLPAAPMIIVCCNGIIALGASNATYSLGLRIPADMSIVGLDNVISNLHQSQIATVQQNLREISLELFELVVNPSENPVSKIIGVSSIEGATCGRVETVQK